MRHFSWQVQFDEVQLSLFVAGAFGEIWNGSRSAKSCIFQYKMRALSAKTTPVGGGLRTDGFTLGSCSDYCRSGK